MVDEKVGLSPPALLLFSWQMASTKCKEAVDENGFGMRHSKLMKWNEEFIDM